MGTDFIRETRADQLQASADMLTDFRDKSAIPLGLAIAFTQENWLLTAASGTSMYTDHKDGHLARQATEIRGYDKPTSGAEDDPKADYKLTKWIMAGLTIRHGLRGELATAGVLGMNLAVNAWRNGEISDDRQMVKDEDLDPRALRAIKINKIKTLLFLSSELLLQSPVACHPTARKIGLTALTAGNVCGIVGQKIYRKQIRELVAEKRAQSI